MRKNLLRILFILSVPLLALGAAGDRPVSRGHIAPRVKATANGVVIIVDISHAKLNDKVQLKLIAKIAGGASQNLKILSNFISTNPKNYRSTREFSMSYSELTKLVVSHGGTPEDVRTTKFYVEAAFQNRGGWNHRWGGVDRGGFIRIPFEGASSQEPAEVLPTTVTYSRPQVLDIGVPITPAYGELYPGLQVGGQIRSRVEGEGKFQLTESEFASVLESLYALAENSTQRGSILGDAWSFEVETRYLQKYANGKLKKDSAGRPIPDPMVDTYYDNENYDAARNDMALRYRWTAGNQVGAWNFKPGMGRATPEGEVYRIEYGVDTNNDRASSITEFADSADPLNFFRVIRDVIKGATPSSFFKPAVLITDFRHKFILQHTSGLKIEVSADDVRAKSLRDSREAVRFFQMEMDIDHLAVKSQNSGAGADAPTQGGDTNAVVGLHTEKDLSPRSPILRLKKPEFDLAAEVILALRQHTLGDSWKPGAQKYAFAAQALKLISPRASSSSVEELNKEKDLVNNIPVRSCRRVLSAE